jgi:alpha,alpha-trehalose phosphorylase
VYRGRRLPRHDRASEAGYELLDGEPLEIVHHGEPVALDAPGHVESRPIPPATAGPRPSQPPGREPPLRPPS